MVKKIYEYTLNGPTYFKTGTLRMNNSDSTCDTKYLIISPVRDESAYIERTLESVVAQTARPVSWVLVDDASKDNTPEIIENYRKQHPWIQLVSISRPGPRLPGSGVIDAFNQGYKLVSAMHHQYVVKLDCDISFSPDYFDRLLHEFTGNGKLGIASGVYLERQNGQWRPISMPRYHAAGASKILRKACFDQIGGFIPMCGWDTVDEIKAQFAGWETCHFKNIQFLHHKTEGSGIGALETSSMHGDIFYLTGGSFPFFVFKCIHRMLMGKPPVLAGASMLVGYVCSLALRKPKLVSQEEEQYYKKILNSRIRECLFASKGFF